MWAIFPMHAFFKPIYNLQFEKNTFSKFLFLMQLNSIMERFAKEAVQKICSLFRYCSSVEPVPAQTCLDVRDDLKKTSQMGRNLCGTTYIQGIWHKCQYQATWVASLKTFCFLVFVVIFVLCSSFIGDAITLSVSPLMEPPTTSHLQPSNTEVSYNTMQFKEEFLLKI